MLMQAQKSENIFHLSIGGGHHNLFYSLKDGVQIPLTGYKANVAFSHFFTSKLGLQIGGGFQTFNSISTLNFTENTPAIDSDMDSYVFKTKFCNWQEKQQVVFLEIPFTGQFKHQINNKIDFLLSVGAKLSLPVSATYQAFGDKLITSGYYPQYNIELTDLPQHGFSEITPSFSGKINMKPLYSAVAELGASYKLTPKIYFHAGGYFSYGLNNILNANTKMLYMIDGTYNSVFQTYQTESLKPISVGLKLGLGFKF